VFDENLLEEHENVALAIYAFSDDLVRLTGPTRDGPALRKAMDAVRAVPAGDTPLFGDIAETARDAASIGGNATRMMVIFSDGESTRGGDSSRAAEAIQVAQELGTALCPVRLPGIRVTFRPQSEWELLKLQSIGSFMTLASATGKEAFDAVGNQDVLPAILKSLANHVRYDYVAGFYPASTGGRKRHKV